MSQVQPKRKKPFLPQIVSANDLLQGDVVYLRADGVWTRVLRQAAIAQSQEEAASLRALGDQPARVVGPYLLDVELTDDGAPAPLHFREHYRERGPSTRLDLGRQADRSLHLYAEPSQEAV